MPSWHFEHLCEKCQGALSELFTMFGSMPAGGVDAAAAAAAIDGRAGSVAAAKKAPKKEEPEGLTTTWLSDCSIRASLSCGPLHCLF